MPMSALPLDPSQHRPPCLAPRLLPRSRLLHLLQEAGERPCRLILLSAPLGYGKSTLLAQYAERLSTPWAWYRLSAADNQPQHLLRQLSQAFGLPFADPADSSREALTLLWRRLLQHLETLGPFTLLLDDLQRLRHPQACQYLDQLLRFAPPSLQLIAATEGTPALPLEHLRCQERLAIVEASELSLDSEELHHLARLRGLTLDSDLLHRLRAASEGWLTGLLFWLSAHRELAPTAAAPELLRSVTQQADTHLAAFFEEELFAGLPTELLAFMEQTSVVQTFEPALADLLSGRHDSAALIRTLLRRDLFLEPRPGADNELRYHGILRAVLYRRLQQRDQAACLQLHRQAADWLLARRRYSEAIHQYGRAGDFHAVLTIAERHTFDLLRDGQVNALVDLLGQVEVNGQPGSDHFTLAISEASIVLVTNNLARIQGCIQRLRQLQRQGIVKHPERVQQTITYLRTLLAFLGGNLRHGLELADRGLLQAPTRNAARAVLHLNRARCLFALGTLQHAREAAQQALEDFSAFGFSGFINIPHLLCGQIELAQGDSAAAMRRFLALEQQSPATASRNVYEVFHQLGLALALIQQNHLKPAHQRLLRAETLALGFPHSAALALVLHHQACLHDALGETARARARWDEARRLARTFRQFGLYRLAGAWRARLAVRERDQAFILDWLQEWHWCQRHYGEDLMPDEWLAYAWVQRHLGQPAVATQILDRLQPQARSERNLRLQLDLWLLAATLQQDRGETQAALVSLDQALQQALSHGFAQLLHYEGRTLESLLRQLLQPALRRQAGLSTPLPDAAALASLLPALPGAGLPAQQTLLEPLTRRELDVLRYMARGYTNQQLADSLFVSLSTVKTHINNLFRKLEVSDRDAALQSARQRRLLD
ncbi:LuxR C-terminal-related transcriptional regulator [Pseudomonas sp. NW5]|uniref:LuxR C-terminal-related transcriptional regulator n=1 Tax=Pseudomonas sp. NW5 TaxID=2934934 RepID=UPI002020F880|nr:LuxR C-terminal-related transcriptional regulator [Pseudomonas sp. NW5]MCL7462962.1 LuxR C-terminal-related transcriptional regulator [Pseudomonas sp. NW5]